MKKTFMLFAIAVMAMVSVELCQAGANDNHTVTVSVATINEINVDNSVTLTIDNCTPGSDPDAVSDNATANLFWSTNARANSKKITVKTSLLTFSHTLKVVAQNVSGTGTTPGTAAAEVTLSSTDADLITGIQRTAAHCDLRYSANTTAVNGDDDEVHTVTFTITNSN
jgi:hypothetical protein